MRLPVLKAARLHAFTLYDTKPAIELSFDEGIACLVGANGLGKSTFLSAIIFALTGRVAEPNRDVLDATLYFKETLPFTEEYFRGRLDELDYDRAYVQVEFEVNSVTFAVRRQIKSPDDLDLLIVNGSELRSSEEGSLADRYLQKLTEVAEISSLEQFTLMVHFLLNFDESRRLLFWEPRLIEPILFLAFGTSPNVASEAGKLRAQAERLNSRARNTRWQASSARTRIAQLEESASSTTNKASASSTSIDQGELRDLMDRHTAAGEQVELSRQRLGDAHARLGLSASEKRDAEKHLEAAFTRALAGKKNWRDHVVVRESMHDGVCALCGTATNLEEHLRLETHCVLCGAETIEIPALQMPPVEEIRSRVNKAEALIVDAEMEVRRLTKDLEDGLRHLDELETAISAYELEERVAVSRSFSGPDSSLDYALEAQRETYSALTAEADEYVRERDNVRRKLRPLVMQLEDAFRSAQRQFVPIFQRLAESFIGRELDIEIMSSPSKPVSLQLRLEGSARDRPTQLSESQRFFLDIALRMALIEYLGAGGATLLVDTPEGSLDVAYEARAGDMFSNFARGSGNILMTSNLNGSRLLRRIAKASGREGLKLERMTEWATLSEVQLDGIELFDEAFRAIVTEFEGS